MDTTHGNPPASGSRNPNREFIQKLSDALRGLTKMTEWADGLLLDLHDADALQRQAVESRIVDAFLDRSDHFFGYCESALRDLHTAAGQLKEHRDA